MIMPAVYFLLLLLSFVPSFHAVCPAGKYCPSLRGVDCGINSTLCESAICPTGGNLLANLTKDCEEGIAYT